LHNYLNKKIRVLNITLVIHVDPSPQGHNCITAIVSLEAKSHNMAFFSAPWLVYSENYTPSCDFLPYGAKIKAGSLPHNIQCDAQW
jgi:hypothetical protein